MLASGTIASLPTLLKGSSFCNFWMLQFFFFQILIYLFSMNCEQTPVAAAADDDDDMDLPEQKLVKDGFIIRKPTKIHSPEEILRVKED
ncbi:unnamed protein product [Brassica oleracea]